MKKLIKLICIVSCLLLCMTGCGKKDTLQYNEKDISQCVNAQIDYSTGKDTNEYSDTAIAIAEDTVKNAVSSWKNIVDECGDYNGEKSDYDLSISNDEITVTQTMTGKNRDFVATATFERDKANDDKMTMTSLSYDEVYTTLEKIEQAGMNTVMGMGTVFIVLIFMSLLISCFKVIPKITEKLENKNKVHESSEITESKEVHESQKENYEDDSELIAVIAAAIAASEQTTTDGFVVRSIRRR